MKRGDKFVLMLTITVFIASIAFIAYYFFKDSSTDRLKAEVYKDGKLIDTIDLQAVDKPKKITVGDDEYNVILVEKGRIRFEEANCKDDVCVKTGWLSKKGEMAVCIPHKTYIKISGIQDEIDGATY